MYNVRKYIRYVRQRVYYADLGLIDISDDEFKFYKFISDNICRYIDSISCLPDYWYGRVGIDAYCEEHNLAKRTMYRRIRKEYKLIVEKILSLEQLGDELWKQ